MLALAEPQERAIRHRSGPLLLSGEAGTGKTEVLARRFESLVSDQTGPDRILVLASARATAQRLRERVEQLLDRPLEELWIGTWEQLCERLLREHSTAAGLDPFFHAGDAEPSCSGSNGGRSGATWLGGVAGRFATLNMSSGMSSPWKGFTPVSIS